MGTLPLITGLGITTVYLAKGLLGLQMERSQ